MVRCRGNTQKLISPGNCGIVDGLHVDVVATHHDVTDLRVFLSVGYLGTTQRQPQKLQVSKGTKNYFVMLVFKAVSI